MKQLARFSLENPPRRRFLQAVAIAGGGFAIGMGPFVRAEAADPTSFAPNPFVRIGADNSVTVVVKHLEMGQGTYTGLPTLVAEELDADWAQIKVEGAPADAGLYNNLLWGPAQGTGGSTAIANSYDQLRKAGAAARAMLVAAAADEWKVPVDSIAVSRGVLTHQASGRTATFGKLAARAALQSVPADVKLKDAKDFKLIGKRIARKDSKAKTNGTAQFTIDVKLPGMLTAVVAHAPLFGAKVKSFDAGKAKAVKGVVDVVQIPTGVAVLANDFWAAKQGRDALTVEWDDTAANKLGSAELLAQYRELAQNPGTVARKDGDAAHALAGAAKKLEATFEFPYLAHAAMEPLDCVVKLTADSCEIWNGEQLQTPDQFAVAKLTGLKPAQIKLNMLYAGGSFGRRANPQSDYIVEAVSIAKAINGRAPVKMIWTREDDMRAGYYRPLYLHTLRAGLDAQGKVIAWQHRIVGQSILAGTPFEPMMVKDGVDATSVEGASTLPYDIPNMLVDLHTTKVGVPVLWWRSVGSTHTAFSTETFIDELAAAAGKDPLEFRRAMLAGKPRHLGVLNLAAQKAGWGKPLAKGHGRGIAVHESFNSFVAQVADVRIAPDGSFKVERVVCAVDCGVAVNPDVIKAQMEGGIGFALSAALHGAITMNKGRVEQSNFHDYQPLRINEMPKIDVYILQSNEKPTGVGEPGVPPVAPAVANAIYAATGKRLRNLPLRLTS
jgi:isoquinoline 1-oxidoreductase subunit beta